MIKSKKLRVPIYGGSYTLILWDDDTELQEKFKSFNFDPPIKDFDGGVLLPAIFDVDSLKKQLEN